MSCATRAHRTGFGASAQLDVETKGPLSNKSTLLCRPEEAPGAHYHRGHFRGALTGPRACLPGPAPCFLAPECAGGLAQ